MITVLLVDDHPLVRGGLRALISSAEDLQVVGEAAGGAEAVALTEELSPDVILMDLSMPGMDGVEATRELLGKRPGTHVVVLTSFHDQGRVIEALRAGATGYLLKDCEPQELLAAVRSASRGDAPLDPRIARLLLPTSTPSTVDTLSGREREVLLLIIQGLSNKQIGRSLGITERTVKVHVGNLFRRIGVADRTSAAMWGRDNLA
ncbi:DNA-binding response regulator [Nakamurella silvestris]|nr:DNA-binding response regulator [Nakamurella silvestris]